MGNHSREISVGGKWVPDGFPLEGGTLFGMCGAEVLPPPEIEANSSSDIALIFDL